MPVVPRAHLHMIERAGNTSSSSIPLALTQPGIEGRRVALCAFGGGYTTAAVIIEQIIPVLVRTAA